MRSSSPDSTCNQQGHISLRDDRDLWRRQRGGQYHSLLPEVLEDRPVYALPGVTNPSALDPSVGVKPIPRANSGFQPILLLRISRDNPNPRPTNHATTRRAT